MRLLFATSSLVVLTILLQVPEQCASGATPSFVAVSPRERPSSSFRATEEGMGETGGGEEGKRTGTWNPLRLAVLRLGLTELRFTSPLNYEKREGRYVCAGCGAHLFDSSGKFDSGSGWPSFWRTASADAVKYRQEWDGRVECVCGNCGGHLGHVFGDGPRSADIEAKDDAGLLQSIPASDPPLGERYGRLPRYCMNGAALRFRSDE